MKALIIIDAQNDFMTGGALAVDQGDKIIAPINSIQNKFDLVVATQDWHPANHKSFASNHPNKKPFEKTNLVGVEQTLWPDHCIQGSWGAELHPELDIRLIEALFRKGMDPEIDSYSGFYDNAHQKTTGLAGFLREKKVTKLYFTGLCADLCVYYSIKDALSEQFSSVLIEDATCPLVPLDYSKIRKELLALGVEMIQSTELI